ncbi:MAG: hypothetical protein JWO03_2862 [Bacteroidetes bacterium]|nr:hypothetical protein [Bacteroidota bacterium]
MLQLIKQPGTGSATGMAWSRSASQLTFVRKGLYDTRGSKAALMLVIADAARPVAGQYFYLSWSQVSLVFRIGTLSGDDSLFITPWSGAFATCAANFVKDLNRHPELSKNFSISLLNIASSKAYFLIEALDSGIAYNLATTGSTITIDGATVNTAGTDDVPLDSYSVTMDVVMTTNIQVEPEDTDLIQLQAVGVADKLNDQMQLAIYELPEIGNAILASELPFRAFSPFIMPRAIGYGQLVAWENYNDTTKKGLIAAYGDLREYLPVRILNGGIALANYPVDVNKELSNQAIKFLTDQDREKIIGLDQPEWLSIYIVPDDYTIHYKVYYTDGSTQEKTTAVTVVNFDTVLCIPAGWQQCGLGALHADRTASYYEVSIYDESQNQEYSETFTYIIDTRYFKDKRYFIVRNSKGGWDTMRTVGANKLSSKFTRVTGMMALDQDSRPAKGTIRMIVAGEEQSWTMRSGWEMGPEDVEYYRQLLMSNYVAEIMMPLIPDSAGHIFQQVFRSVIVQQDTIDIYDTQDSKWSVEWKMMYAHNETNYSKIATAIEPYFDSVLEFHVTAVTTTTLHILQASNNIRYKINGKIVTPSAGNFTLVLGEDSHIIVEAEGLIDFQFDVPSGYMVITPKRIASATLEKLYLLDFLQVDAHYLVSRLPRLYALTHLSINTADSGFLTDSILIAAQALTRGGIFALSVLSLASSTPTTKGYLVKTYLTGFAITVTTL